MSNPTSTPTAGIHRLFDRIEKPSDNVRWLENAARILRTFDKDNQHPRDTGTSPTSAGD